MNRLVSLAVACAVVAGACSSGADDTTTTTAAPTTTASVTELTLAGEEGLAPGTYEPESNPLPPGTYTTNVIDVPITFTVPDAWVTLNEAQIGPAWIPAEPIGLSFIAAIEFHGEVWEDPCGTSPPVEIENNAHALIEWLAAHPDLNASEIEEVTIGGVPGYQIVVETSVPEECSEPPWVFLLALPIVGDYHLDDDMTARITTVDVGGTTLFISVESLTEDWDLMKSVADPFVEALDIG